MKKNILAENLLRFRAKNLSESDVTRLMEQDPPDSRGEDQRDGIGVYSVGNDSLSGPISRGETQITKKDEKGNLILPEYQTGGLAGQTLWFAMAKERAEGWNSEYKHHFKTPIKAALNSGGRIYIWNNKETTPVFNKNVLNQLYLGIDINEYKQNGGNLQGLESLDTRQNSNSENLTTINNKYNLGGVTFTSPRGAWSTVGRVNMLPSYRSALSGAHFKPRSGNFYTITPLRYSGASPATRAPGMTATVHYNNVGNIGMTHESIFKAYTGEESLGKAMDGFNIIEDPAGDAAIQNVLAGKDPLGRDFSNKNKNKNQQQHWANVKNIILKGVE
jgi:hypothetical protein